VSADGEFWFRGHCRHDSAREVMELSPPNRES
jgi:hypothetical protein